MGVPKFYRWISERYPKINQVITDSALLPEFDHLYLDMNGIIHGCTHPSHLDISDTLSEKDMMLGIMHYIDRIVTQIVKPKVSLYMAIDGVAPRAKLNQQRSRRFRSAKDLKESTENSKSNSKSLLGNSNASEMTELPSDAFDSNCITPGTEFMARVSNAIKYFIRLKIKEDPLWRNLKVIFSGHEIPGEGEHKIMQHIRNMKSQPGYQPNTRHCMYGQDADLIMLGLVSHEPHFTLLREIVDFGGGFNHNKNSLKTVKKFTKESDFQLLHLSILREYLEIEFATDFEKDSYNLEAIIDDFVFMTFLVGNDFLPHMPSLDIGENAFDLLFNTYKEQRLSWGEGQYLTESGRIPDSVRLESFLAVIGAAETEIFEEREINDGIYLQKKRKWDKRDGKPAGPTDEELAEVEERKQQNYLEMIEKISNDPTLKDVIELPKPGQKDFKGRYYFEKLEFTPLDVESHLALRKAYVEGLMWCLAYYYRGCISWGWFYPYHYGPLLSDLKGLPEIFKQIKFDIGSPLRPFEQLMGCLPPASSKLVPRPYRNLMCNPDSPIKHFYPEEFEVDMNGKRNPWEGVNLLPFIDIDLLRSTIAEKCPDTVLTLDEKKRNSKGKVLCFTHDFTSKETIPSFNRGIGVPDIVCCHSRVDVIEEFEGTESSFKAELISGTQIPYPGFPSLNVIPITHNELNAVGLNCFGSSSKYSTRVLTLHKLPQLPSATLLAEKILGSSLFINWPMMHEARVTGVSDSTCEVKWEKGKPNKVKSFKDSDREKWEAESSTIAQQYLAGNGIPGSGGVNIGEIQIRLKLRPLQGMKTSPIDGSTRKQFGKEEAEVPLQMVLWKAPAPDTRFIERGPLKLHDRFPVNSNIIVAKGKYRGCKAVILGVAGKEKIGVKVEVVPPEPPFGLAIVRSVKDTYVSAFEAAKLLRMKASVFGRITGSISFDPGRYDLGLNLTNKDEFFVNGYSRIQNITDDNLRGKAKSKDAKKKAWSTGDSLLVVGSSRGFQAHDKTINRKKLIWEFTPHAIRIVAAYRQQFPQIFAHLNKFPHARFYDAKKVFGPSGESMLPKVRGWLDSIETAQIPRSPSSTISMPLAAAAAVERAADVRLAAQKQAGPYKEVNVRLPPSAVFVEGSVSPTTVIQTMDFNDSSPPELGDRIVNLCANGLVFGARGTVISVHDPKSGCVEVIMDDEFIGGSTLQGTCSSFRGKLCIWAHLLKISAADSKGFIEKMLPSEVQKIKDKEGMNGGMIPSKVTSEQISQSEQEKNVQLTSTAQTNTPSKTSLIPRINPTPSGKGGKQGAWKEALGPHETSTGFKSVKRNTKSGFRAWQEHVSRTDNKKSKVKEKDDPMVVGLKSMLGVKEGHTNISLQFQSSQTHDSDQNGNTKVSDATAALKAKLGLGLGHGKTKLPSDEISEKPALMKESQMNKDLMSIPLPSPPPITSATKALEDLMMKTSITPPIVPHAIHQPAKSNFNFNYIQEGEQPESTTFQPELVPHDANKMIPQQITPINFQGSAYPVLQAAPFHQGNNAQNLSSPQVPKTPSIIPRNKKGKNGTKNDGEQSIVPSAVVTKLKK